MQDTMLEQHTVKRARVSLSKKKHTQKAHRIQKRAKKNQARSQAERKDVNSAMSYLGQGRGRDFAAAAASHASVGSPTLDRKCEDCGGVAMFGLVGDTTWRWCKACKGVHEGGAQRVVRR